MWRGTGLPVKFLILDARSCLPILLAVVHWSWTTLIIGVLGTAFLAPFRFWAHLACCPADGAPLAHWQETHGSPDMEATEILMNISASIVRVDDVAHGVLTLLSEIERPAIVVDRATGQEASVSHEEIARADGYLPVIVVAAEALWFDLTGTGFALDVRENAEATLGYSLHGIRAGSWSVLMLCIIDLSKHLP